MRFVTRPEMKTIALALLCASIARPASVSGRVTDIHGTAVEAAQVRLIGPARRSATTGVDGTFSFSVIPDGSYELLAAAPPFVEEERTINASENEVITLNIQFGRLQPRTEAVTVSADLKGIDVSSPDPAVKVFASEDLLDANPGRPGAPLSIPGYPAETASSGIKAPQYFAPGVAGDHGEPVAQYVKVGSYLLPNNLSANAHGNGYTDPNVYIASAIEAVEVDGGAFNVREGNHALNLATSYALRSHLDPFFTLTGDQRDIAATGGFSPSDRSWIALEASYGNGFLDRLEHRQQFKINGGEVFQAGSHIFTLFGAGYYGFSYMAGLRPIYGFNAGDTAAGWKADSDTIDPRQKDQTHTALIAFNDVWKPGEKQELQLSGFFRTYNLSLFSDFGDGLIRQSEFRTVAGGSAVYIRKFSNQFTILSGADYEREAPRRDDLDHYNFFNPAVPNYYGPFTRVDGSNITISPLSPYIAAEGGLTRYFRYYIGLRRDEIFISNQDLVAPANSSKTLDGVNSPKATLTFFPKDSWHLPEIAFSFGKSFFTEDPRVGAAETSTKPIDPVETARSYQLAITRHVHSNTELKLTLGRETQTAEYGKVDADTGLRFDLGPGRIRYMAATLRHNFNLGSLEATFEQADARQLDSGQVTPEAPRLIGDFSWTYQKLPFRLRVKGEYEYVGRRVLGTGCNAAASEAYCVGVPTREFRFAVSRSFQEEKLNVGLNLMLARGFTGQTTENFATNYKPGYAGPLPVLENPVAEVVGVRLASYASVNFTYRFGR